MENITVGYAMCGSFCTLKQSVSALEELSRLNIKIIPIMSNAVYTTDTRFGKAEDFRNRVAELCGTEIIHDIPGAEPIGPKRLLDLLIVCPCTGNTVSKIAMGITDSAVTMAAKAHLRNGRPIVLALASNDGLGASGKNIGLLHNTKNIYFVPYGQDDAINKPTSLVSDFTRIGAAAEAALSGKQIQPVLL